MKSQALSKILTAFCLALLMSAMAVSDAQAQRQPGAIGIGGQIGQPSGITLMVYNPSAMSYDFLAAWDTDDFFFLNAHGLFERHLGNRGQLHFFYGPGAFIGFRDRDEGDDDTVAGLSGRVGLGLLIDRFEIYGQVTPRLALTPGTEGDVGGGLGFRFYF